MLYWSTYDQFLPCMIEFSPPNVMHVKLWRFIATLRNGTLWELVQGQHRFLLGFFVFNTCTCTIIQNWTSSHKNLGELLWIIYKTYSAILQNVNFIRNTIPCKANRRTRGGSWWWSNGTLSYSGDRRPPSGMFPWRRRRKSASNRRTPPDQVRPPSAVIFLCEE